MICYHALITHKNDVNYYELIKQTYLLYRRLHVIINGIFLDSINGKTSIGGIALSQ